MIPKAVIFDLDGTLLNTLQDLANSVNTVLANNGFPTHPLDAFRYFVGRGVDYMLEQALPPNRRTPDSVQKYVTEFSAHYAQHWADFTLPYPGIPEMLHSLTAKNLPYAILSNKPHGFTQKCVQQLLGEIQFRFIWGHKQEYPRKPEPESALALADLLGYKPDEIMFIGDSSIDMQTATNAGMNAAGVAWGFRSVEELQEHGAHHIFYTPEEISAFIIKKDKEN